jgi:hypothetical protein
VRRKKITAQTMKALRVTVNAWQDEQARGLNTTGDDLALEIVVRAWRGRAYPAPATGGASRWPH